MIPSFTALNNPLAQIAAAEEFCESIHAYVQDEYEEFEKKEPPDIEELDALAVLGVLARLGLRFDIGDGDAGEYFGRVAGDSILDRLLHGYASLVVRELEGLIARCQTSVRDLVTIHGCHENLIFVPDIDRVVPMAYFEAE